MSEAKRRILYLLVDGLPEAQRPAIPSGEPSVEIFTLSEDNAREALEKMFAADSVSVWGRVD